LTAFDRGARLGLTPVGASKKLWRSRSSARVIASLPASPDSSRPGNSRPSASWASRRLHTAIREDASINLAAVADMRKRFPDLDVTLIEAGGDNLAGTFSPEVADITIYFIDVSGGVKIRAKAAPGSHARTSSSSTRPIASLRWRLARGHGPGASPD
jgi:hypothetical protein